MSLRHDFVSPSVMVAMQQRTQDILKLAPDEARSATQAMWGEDNEAKNEPKLSSTTWKWLNQDDNLRILWRAVLAFANMGETDVGVWNKVNYWLLHTNQNEIAQDLIVPVQEAIAQGRSGLEELALRLALVRPHLGLRLHVLAKTHMNLTSVMESWIKS